MIPLLIALAVAVSLAAYRVARRQRRVLGL